MIINRTNMDGLFSGFSTVFNKAFAGAESQYRSIAMIAPSMTREQNYAWLGQMPRLREWLGPRHIKSIAAYGYSIKNKNFEATVEVEANDIKDDQYGVYSPLFEELGRSAAVLPDELVFGLLSSGFNTPCFDGQNFFDTEHPSTDAGGADTTVANMVEGEGEPWYLLDTSRAIKPVIYQERETFRLIAADGDTDYQRFVHNKYLYGVEGRANVGFGLWQLAYASRAPLTIENYVAARSAMAQMRGDGGKLLGIKGDTLLVSTAQEAAGRAVIHKTHLEGGESNEWAETAKLLVSPWLES